MSSISILCNHYRFGYGACRFYLTYFSVQFQYFLSRVLGKISSSFSFFALIIKTENSINRSSKSYLFILNQLLIPKFRDVNQYSIFLQQNKLRYIRIFEYCLHCVMHKDIYSRQNIPLCNATRYIFLISSSQGKKRKENK